MAHNKAQEDKKLLSKDLCARLLYEVKGRVYAEVSDGKYDISGDMIFYDAPFDVILEGINVSTEEIHVVAIGNAASIGSIGSNVDGAIMLGSGINNNAHTFRVGLGVFENGAYTTYEMLDSEGKVPGERMSKQSSSAPTTSTVGNIGQFYVDTTNEDGYMCVGIDDTDPENIVYTWKQITV